MPSDSQTLLVRYQYDALNRLVDCAPLAQSKTQRFYLNDRLTTEVQGATQRSVMQHGDQLLAEQQGQSGIVNTRLLVTDQQRSVLNILDARQPNPRAYTPYGHGPAGNGLLSLLGFNGERPDPVTGCYLLGTGHHRPFNPVLMCFISPDSWSPFGEGGLNAYAYCIGDPVNRADQTGHFSKFLTSIFRKFKHVKTKPPEIQRTVPPISIQIKGDTHVLVGFHGTSADHATTMQVTGLKPEFDTKPNNSFGRGFYTTSRISKAKGFADFKAKRMFDSNPDGLLAVYVKNPIEISSEHYRFVPEHSELILRKEMYSSVVLVPFNHQTMIGIPELDINRIFKIPKITQQIRKT